MECTLESSDIAGDRGFLALGDFFTKNPNDVYDAMSNVLEVASDFFNLTQETAEAFGNHLSIAASAFSMTSALGDGFSFLKSTRECAQTVFQSGVFSGEFAGAAKEVVRDFGNTVMDIYSSGVFLSALKIANFANPIFKMFAMVSVSFSLLFDVYDNIGVVADGSEGKATLTQVQKDLIKHNHTKNQYSLMSNALSLSVTVLEIAGMVFCPVGTLVIGFVSLGGSLGQFFEEREMQVLAAESALSK